MYFTCLAFCISQFITELLNFTRFQLSSLKYHCLHSLQVQCAFFRFATHNSQFYFWLSNYNNCMQFNVKHFKPNTQFTYIFSPIYGIPMFITMCRSALTRATRIKSIFLHCVSLISILPSITISWKLFLCFRFLELIF